MTNKSIGSFFLVVVAAMMATVSLGVVLPASAAGKTVTVTMTDKPPKYIPDKLTIPVGTTVVWKNTAQTLHDVTTDASSVQDKADVHLPPGAKPFDSGFMPPGATFKYTFTVPGHYVYVCVPHEKDKMIGVIDVTK